MRPRRAHLGRLDQVQGRKQDHRRDAGADRGFGHRHVDRIEHDQHARHQEAVDGGQDDDAEQAALAHDGDRHDGEQRQQRHVDEDFYGCLPSPRLRCGGRGCGGPRPASAGFFVQAGLRQRVRHDRAGEEEQREQEQQLQRDQAEARLQPHAEDQKADPERVGDARRVHAGEDVGHAHEPEGSDDR